MTLCEKCIHGEICAERDCHDEDDERALKYCVYFKNKADVQEVKHGKWTKVEITREEYKEINYQHKECKVSPLELHKCNFEFCPRCGATMDGKKEE